MKYIVFIISLIGLDFISKYWAENILTGEIVIIPNILSFQYAQNIGIAFSIPLT
jgi:lipoprotein signal peptidase